MEKKLKIIIFVMGCMVFYPQPGYIHPDEFFQSVEVVAGDVLNVSHYRSWEFDPDMPLRDITLLYTLFAPGFYLLRIVTSVLNSSSMVISAYGVIITPRMVMACASIVNFVCLLKLCDEFGSDKNLASWYWFTSYAVWVFLARTFSNTIETILFSFVCIVILELVNVIRDTQIQSITIKNFKGKKITKTTQYTKGRNNYKRYVFLCILLGFLVCLGFFNRPTFLAFVCVPMCLLAHKLYVSFESMQHIIFSCMLAGASFITTFICLCGLNTLYYNPQSLFILQDIFNILLSDDWKLLPDTLKIGASALRIPPWNFLIYNTQATNLAKHGLHPRYTHLFLGMPSLLGPLSAVIYWDVILLAQPPVSKYSNKWLTAMVIFPVLVLSLFPHQEPRFLLPIVPVAIVCTAKRTLGNRKLLKALALFFNIMGYLFFGLLHQGGLIPALSFIERYSKDIHRHSTDGPLSQHLLFYFTYMPPRHILLANPESVDLKVHDLGGSSQSGLMNKIAEVRDLCKEKNEKCCLYVILPGSASEDLDFLMEDFIPTSVPKDMGFIKGYSGMDIIEFCPHLSMEKLPRFVDFLSSNITVSDFLSQFCLKIIIQI